MRLHQFLTFVLSTFGVIGTCTGQSALASFRQHNTQMAALQPALITPLITPDPRLVQYARFSVSHSYTPSGAETVNYGNCRGGGIVLARRFELDWMPPTYIQHNSDAADGAGDTSVLVKGRLASGAAEGGNFELAAVLTRNFATGSHANGARTGSYVPTVVGAKTFGRFDVISAVSGTLPTGRVAEQGRSIAWNTAVQMHASRNAWVEAENNATWFQGGSHDGYMQNFVTPAAFYVVHGRDWAPQHPYLIVDAGMQIATSRFHTYNHNLITEVRVLF